MFAPQNFDRLLGTQGFSDTLLKNHFTLYQGYVTNTNKVSDRLQALLGEGKTTTAEFMELKRRFGWEFNGMRLHEFYFGNMDKKGVTFDASTKVGSKIIESYGSFDAWSKDFKATGAIRGIGWAVLVYDQLTDRVFNVWVNEHDVGLFAGTIPLLVLDIFEHAYITDYALKRVDYIDAFMNSIDWSIVAGRLEK